MKVKSDKKFRIRRFIAKTLSIALLALSFDAMFIYQIIK